MTRRFAHGLCVLACVCVAARGAERVAEKGLGVVSAAERQGTSSARAVARTAADSSSPRYRIAYATYLGGSKQERNVYGLGLDRRGNVAITSATRSPDAPTTPGAFQPKFGGGVSDVLVAKLSPDASRLLYATYLGGSGNEFAEHQPWLTPDGCLQPKHAGKGDAFVVKLVPDRD